jgi:PAS domain S-box-containing protein
MADLGGVDPLARRARKIKNPIMGEENERLERARLQWEILQATPIAVFGLDQDRRISLWNRGAERVFGWSAEEVLGASFPHVQPRRRAEAQELWERVVREGRLEDLELLRVRKDGAEILVRLSAAAVHDDAGRFHGVVATVEDVTERRRREAEREERDRRYRALFDTIHLGVVYQDAEGRILGANPAAERLLGVSVEQMMDRTSSDPRWRAVHEDGSEFPGEEHPSMKALRTGEQVQDVILGMFHPGREEYRWLKVNAVPQFREGDERAYQVYTSFEDVTEKRRAEEEALRSERRARAVYESLPIATFLFERRDGEMVLVDHNTAGVRFTGRDVLRLTGKSMTEIMEMRPEMPDTLLYNLERVIDEKRSMRREVEYPDPDGNGMRHLVMHYGFVPPESVIVHAEDVTDQKQTEEQLRQAQKMEAVGRLAGGIAHDFNNLLTAINGYAALAMDVLDESEPVREDVAEIRKAGKRATALTRQLLAFSRRQVLKPEVLCLDTVVKELEGMLARLLGEDIELVTSLDAPDATVKADRGQLDQVILNLAVNARDAMDGGGTLLIETRTQDLDEHYASQHVAVTPGPYVMLSITDTGQGMDDVTLSQVFEPFFTTKELGKGTGLGLSTVYGIVKQSGGNIWAYSELGRGSTFKVYLPRVDGKARRASSSVPPVQARRKTTVLVVEDEPSVLELTRRILSAAGYDVRTAVSPRDALAICEDDRCDVDLMITDVVMPDMHGKELADRAARILPGLRVLFMSGYTDDAVTRQGVVGLGTRFIEKPFTAAELTARVRAMLE